MRARDRDRKKREANREASLRYRQKNPSKNAENCLKWRNSNPEPSAESRRLWRNANPEQSAESRRIWRDANLEKSAESIRIWRDANPEKSAECRRIWRNSNPEKSAESRRLWRNANRQRHSESFRIWRNTNREQFAEACKSWRMANRQQAAEIRRNWRRKNPEKSAASRKKWRIKNRFKAYRSVIGAYIKNSQKKLLHRNASYKRRLLIERQIRRQRYRMNLAVDGQYYGPAKALYNTGIVVVEQRFIQAAYRRMLNRKKTSLANNISVLDNAKTLILKALNLRKQFMYRLKRQITYVKSKCSAILTNANGKDDPSLEDYCGEGEHRKSREPFFKEFAYNETEFGDTDSCDSAEEDEEVSSNNGKLNNQQKKRTEPCDPNRCLLPPNGAGRLRQLLLAYKKENNFRKLCGYIDKCKSHKEPGKRGHPINCLPHKCDSNLMFFRQLAVHYPTMSTFVRRLYELRQFDRELYEVDVALIKGNVKKLKELNEKLKIKPLDKIAVTVKETVITAEEQLRALKRKKEFQEAIQEIPSFRCSSCNILHSRSGVVGVTVEYDEDHNIKIYIGNKNRKGSLQPINNLWADLIAYINIKSDEGDDSWFVCNKCCKSLKDGKHHSSISVFNKMDVAEIPVEIEELNAYERLLLQKAKCFQTVLRLGAIGSKLPAADRVQAIKGQVLHYPLPISETLKTLPNENEMPADHNLNILINGVPTKQRVIWKSIVDIEKVKKAFLWYRKHNPEYGTVRSDWCPLCEDEMQDEEAGPSNQETIDCCRRVANKPMIRRVDEEEQAHIVENYTVYPMQKTIPQESDLELFQMERVHAEHIDNREEKLDLWCFPHLFPDGRNGAGEEREQKVSNPEWIKSRLLNADPRFRHDHQYIFDLLHQYHVRSAASAVYQSLRNTKQFDDAPVGEFIQQMNKNPDEVDRNLHTMFENIRGTAEYFSSIKRDVQCMVRELGPPTWFVTLSAAEYEWEDMTNLLLELNKQKKGIKDMRNGERCAMDPVFVTSHFHHRFSAFFHKVILAEGGGPLGEVVDWFWRVEYQSRGAPHIHMVLWVKDAPRLGVDSSKKIAEFIMKHVTCSLPDENEDPELHRIITRHQTHHVCNSYCRPDKRKKCRFGFPRPPTETFVLNDALATCRKRSKGINSRLYELPRKVGEELINDYNPEISRLWGANTDVQYIGDETNAVVNYIVSYITKKEQSSLNELWDEIDHCKAMSKRLFQFAIKKITCRECGAYEACDTLLGRHLYEKSREVQYINARKPSCRPRQLKPLWKLKGIAENDPNSTNKYENDWFNDFYPNRPDVLENMCIYELRRLYDRVAGENKNCDLAFKNIDGYLKLRKKPRLISHPIFKPNEPDENYWYMLLLLFKPFRDETAELLDPETGKCEPVFEKELLCNPLMATNHEKLQKQAHRVQANDEAIRGPRTEDKGNNADPDDEIEDPIGAPMEAAEAMNEFMAGARIPNHETIAEKIEKMNPDQLRTFNNVTDHLTNRPDEQLFLHTGGAGGTGKSYFIETLKVWAKQFYQSEISPIAVVAPTGLSAFNVGGMTMHRFFQLPVQHGQTAKYKELSNDACKELKVGMKHVKIVVIDEISMVSNLMLAYTHLRLRQIFNKPSEYFGGLHIIAMGDFTQLTPVNASPVFVTLTPSEVKNKIGGLPCSINLWTLLFRTYEELTISMRQKDDPAYGDILNRLRFGCINSEDIKKLESRLIPMLNQEVADEKANIETIAQHYLALRKDGKEAVCLLPTSAMVAEFNNYLISTEKNQIYDCMAEDQFEFPGRFKNVEQAKEMLKKREEKVTETAGLETMLRLSVGCRVMLRRNVEVETGLVNGAIGRVESIIVRGQRVEKVKVKFDNRESLPEFERSKVKFELNKLVTVERQQFPLILAYSMTIHKSQGLSLDHVMADVGNAIFQEGMTYVALSRVRTLNGLHLINFDPSRARANEICLKEINRLREMHQPPIPPIEITKKKPKWEADRKWSKAVPAEKKAPNDNRKRKNNTEKDDGGAAKITRKNNNNRPNNKTANKNIPRKQQQQKQQNKQPEKQQQNIIQWPQFDNQQTTNVCYANSAMQSLLILEPIENACIAYGHPNNTRLERAMYDMYTEYNERKETGGKKIFTGAVRRGIGEPFNSATQQCSFEFIRQLLAKLTLIDIFYLKTRTSHRCTNCLLQNFSIKETAQQIFLSVNIRKNNASFNEMIRGWEPVEGIPCPDCGTGQHVQADEELIETSDYLILYFPRHSGIAGQAPINRPINGFNSDKIDIGQFSFHAVAAILHFGQSSKSGHYMAHIRTPNYGWLKCNDDTITKLPTFQENLQNVSLIILKKLPPADDITSQEL